MGDKLKVEFRARAGAGTRDLQLVGSGEDQGPGDKLVHGWCMVPVGAVVRYLGRSRVEANALLAKLAVFSGVDRGSRARDWAFRHGHLMD